MMSRSQTPCSVGEGTGIQDVECERSHLTDEEEGTVDRTRWARQTGDTAGRAGLWDDLDACGTAAVATK